MQTSPQKTPKFSLVPCYPLGFYTSKLDSELKHSGYVNPLVVHGSSFYCEVSGRSGMDHLIIPGTKWDAAKEDAARESDEKKKPGPKKSRFSMTAKEEANVEVCHEDGFDDPHDEMCDEAESEEACVSFEEREDHNTELLPSERVHKRRFFD